MAECGNAEIKLGSFYFVLGFLVWFGDAYGDLNPGHDLVGDGGCVYGGMRGWYILGEGKIAGWENRRWRGSGGMRLRTQRLVLRSESRGRRRL